MSDAVVCGFWDTESGLAGLGWSLAGSAGGLVLRDGAVIPASDVDASADGSSPALRLSAPDESFEVELKPRSGPSALPGAEAEAATCQARVRVDGGRRQKCEGHLTRWAGDPTASAGVFRHLAVPSADGALLVSIARAEPGAPDHAAEASAAWLIDPEGGVAAYPEALVSTQYDADGAQTRVGLELWGTEEDAPPLRAAGTAAGEGLRQGNVTAALLRTSAEGHAGVGTSVIWRA
jgi:hypothetical protein